MHRLLRVSLVLGLFLLSASLVGCGGEEVGDIQDSEEVKAVDQTGQAAMEEFMKSQGKAQ